MSIMTSRQSVECRYCKRKYAKSGIVAHERSHGEFYTDVDNQASLASKINKANKINTEQQIVPVENIPTPLVTHAQFLTDTTDIFQVCLNWFPDDPLMLAVMSSLGLVAQGKGERLDHLKSAQSLLDMVIKKESLHGQGVFPVRT
jgi:hypothetical protein